MKTKPYVDNFLLEKIIRDDPFITPDERFFMLMLKAYRHTVTLECNPPLAWIADKVGKSTRTLYRTIANLQEKDYLWSVRRGLQKPNNYYFAADFKAALIAYRCPHFPGCRATILRANRKRWVNQEKRNGDSVTSGPDTAMSHPNNKSSSKGIFLHTTCPHCGLPIDSGNGK